MTFRRTIIWTSDGLVFLRIYASIINITILIDMIKVIVFSVVTVVNDYLISDIIMIIIILVISYFIIHSYIVVYLLSKINNYTNIYQRSV